MHDTLNKRHEVSPYTLMLRNAVNEGHEVLPLLYPTIRQKQSPSPYLKNKPDHINANLGVENR